MTNRTMKNQNPSLSAYMNYVSDEGLDLERFVEQGCRLLKTEDHAGLACEMAGVREKIATLRVEHPLLGRQLSFLADLIESDPSSLPEKARNEAAFALLYAAKDMDLMPDDIPGVGYLDDAEITEIVLSRNSGIFERYCIDHGIEWEAVSPEISH